MHWKLKLKISCLGDSVHCRILISHCFMFAKSPLVELYLFGLFVEYDRTDHMK